MANPGWVLSGFPHRVFSRSWTSNSPSTARKHKVPLLVVSALLFLHEYHILSPVWTRERGVIRMPRPSQRVRSEKRVRKRLPGGRRTVQYRQKTFASPRCHLCGQPLAGIPSLSQSAMSKLNRTKKRVGRPYSGQLCHNCHREALKEAARTLQH